MVKNGANYKLNKLPQNMAAAQEIFDDPESNDGSIDKYSTF